jgi:ribonuclease P protein component
LCKSKKLSLRNKNGDVASLCNSRIFPHFLSATRNTFTKKERLNSRKQIELLFSGPRSFVAFPLKLIFLEVKELPLPLQAMFVVPKRNFKRAHDRNRLRRRIKEAYRLNKSIFYKKLAESNKKYIIAFLFTGKQDEVYSKIESAVKKTLSSLAGNK